MNVLMGKRLLILRSPDDVPGTEEIIRRAGAIPVSCPMISLRWPDDSSELDKAIRLLPDYDWLVFTSANSVRFFNDRRLHLDQTDPPANDIAAIGPATAEALAERLWPVRFIAENSTGVDFVLEFEKRHEIQDHKFLLPLSAIARKTVPDGLRQRGGIVTEVTAYLNEPVKEIPGEILEQLEEGLIDWVLFTSSSTVRNFLSSLPEDSSARLGWCAASIGPKTSETLREQGIHDIVEAQEHTVEGLIKAIMEWSNP